MKKRLLAILLAVIMVAALGTVSALADEGDNYGLVRGYYNDEMVDGQKAEERFGFFIEFPKDPFGRNMDDIYFQSFNDAITASTEGFYIISDGETYYITDKENVEVDASDKKNFSKGKPFTIIVDSENHENSYTITEDISINKEVHFMLASSNPTGGRVPETQQINFTGQITIKSGGSFLQEHGGAKSSATVTLSHPIDVESGGTLTLMHTGGVDSKAGTSWKLSDDSGNSVINIQNGGTANLRDVSVSNVSVSGTLNINPYTSTDAEISQIEVSDNGKLRVDNSGNGVTKITNLTVDNGGTVELNDGSSVDTLSLSNGASATIDDVEINTVNLSSGSTVTIGENFGNTNTAFQLPVGAKVVINGTEYSPSSDNGSIDQYGNVSLPGGGTTEGEELSANTIVTVSGVIASGTTEMPTVNENGEVIVPPSGGSVTINGVTTNMPAGGKVDDDGNVTVTTVPATGVTLNKATLSLYVGDSETLTSAVEPSEATDTVNWTSSDPSVATVDENGVVTALGPGTATITATVDGVTAECVVTVSAPVVIPETYPIALVVSDGGEAKTSLTNASRGSVITVTATPDEGYELAYITVDGERINGTKFTMPEHAVTVRVYFTTGELPFADVASNAWYFYAVRYAYENGLMDGVSATEFNPDGGMTRGMVWAILARMDGETVTGTNWLDAARAWAVESGVSDGTDPNGLVTREQFATMLWRFAGEPASSYSLSAYADAGSVSTWAVTAMRWAVENGVISGVTANTLVPGGTTTRAQCAAMLMRFAAA